MFTGTIGEQCARFFVKDGSAGSMVTINHANHEKRRLTEVKNYKLILIVVGTIFAVVFATFLYSKSVENKAIVLEESISESKSAISKEEQRRVDLFSNLVDAIQNYNSYESNTLEKIVDARKTAESGDVEKASEKLSVVVEKYPDLKSQKNYQTTMKEFSITENRLADYRDNYNDFVKQYKRYIRKFPVKQFLSMSGYDIQSYKYLEFTVDNKAATNLFGK